ncbi:DUF4265 domain-containing protein [Archangium gephyra]|uniref:DUF4265 domain-containing protein n=1 Tax=Archangium gephyra TaxID=48 RepID=UPI0035D40C39
MFKALAWRFVLCPFNSKRRSIEETEVPVVIERFAGLGCLSERSQIPGLIALDVPPSIRWREVKRLLVEGEAEERWDYEEACLPNESSPGARE